MRLGALVLWLMLAPLALLALPLALVLALIDPRGYKHALRAVDHLVNAVLFGGSAYESLSSHAWRRRDRWWARLVIGVTDAIERGHCEEANRREQPVVDFITGASTR